MNQLYIVDFTNDDATHSFKFKEKITCQRTNVGANNSPIKISKYFLGARQLSLINCKINLMLTWSAYLV